jgi:hypothetical protein
MRKTLLTAVAAAFLLSTAGSGLVLAQVSNSAVKSAAERKDPAEADAAGAKADAKGAEKAAHTAKSKAKTAKHDAKVAADKADTAAKASIDANNKP